MPQNRTVLGVQYYRHYINICSFSAPEGRTHSNIKAFTGGVVPTLEAGEVLEVKELKASFDPGKGQSLKEAMGIARPMPAPRMIAKEAARVASRRVRNSSAVKP